MWQHSEQPSALNVKVKKFTEARVNGGCNYDSRRYDSAFIEHWKINCGGGGWRGPLPYVCSTNPAVPGQLCAGLVYASRVGVAPTLEACRPGGDEADAGVVSMPRLAVCDAP